MSVRIFAPAVKIQTGEGNKLKTAWQTVVVLGSSGLNLNLSVNTPKGIAGNSLLPLKHIKKPDPNPFEILTI